MIANQISDLRTSMDAQFAKVDTRFDELKAQLRTEIASVRGDVRLVAEALAARHKRDKRNAAEHKAFLERFEGHDQRILALERRKR